jgi:hypothetical protein
MVGCDRYLSVIGDRLRPKADTRDLLNLDSGRQPSPVERRRLWPIQPEVHREGAARGRRQPVGFFFLSRRFALDVEVEGAIGIERSFASCGIAVDRIGREELRCRVSDRNRVPAG